MKKDKDISEHNQKLTTSTVEINPNEKEFLKFYMEQTWIEMRHIETLRERVTFSIITLCTAIIGFVLHKDLKKEYWILVLFVVVFGIYGLLISLKYYQIHQNDQKRLNYWYRYFESFCGDNPQIIIKRDAADTKNEEDFKEIVTLRHHYFWAGAHGFLIIIGLYLLWYILSK